MLNQRNRETEKEMIWIKVKSERESELLTATIFMIMTPEKQETRRGAAEQQKENLTSEK